MSWPAVLPARFARCRVALLVSILQALAFLRVWGAACDHHAYDNVAQNVTLIDGGTIYRVIQANETHRFGYYNYNETTIRQPPEHRKLIINLEPCHGVVYLFVWKARQSCWPNPYSCIALSDSNNLAKPGYRRPANCTWTHFSSEIDGSRDGAPTTFELPLSATDWLISVFAPEDAAYTLTVIANDIGAVPRLPDNGRLTSRQELELEFELFWKDAFYVPSGIFRTKQYSVFSSLLLDHGDSNESSQIFVRKNKVMNTVCGLNNVTDQPYAVVPQAMCADGTCSTKIQGVIPGRKYAFNVYAESDAGFRMAYAGLIMRTEWKVAQANSDDMIMNVVGVVSGSLLIILVSAYLVIYMQYG